MKNLVFIISIMLLSEIAKSALPVKMGLYDVVGGGGGRFCYEEVRQGPDHANQIAIIGVTAAGRTCESNGTILKFDCKTTSDALLFCENKISDKYQNQIIFVNDSSFWQKGIQDGKVVMEFLFELVEKK